MGSAFAKTLSGFDCKVIAHDKYKITLRQALGDNYVKQVDLETIYKETDVLSIHLPLSEETYHYVNKEFLLKFKKPIYIINTARGNNVCVTDLVEALKINKVLGACLDVLEYETKSFETIASEELPEDFKYLAQSDVYYAKELAKILGHSIREYGGRVVQDDIHTVMSYMDWTVVDELPPKTISPNQGLAEDQGEL